MFLYKNTVVDNNRFKTDLKLWVWIGYLVLSVFIK